ncbi:GNAT family N-acetyltransferase [Streptosporangium sandarakinum]|uniref:GNAT family N-acetyltransferase n=1 Tax=Streptosporangium sandarakinum TaxID=1260955 RepID=UPI00371112B8
MRKVIGLRRVGPAEFTARLDAVLAVYTAAMRPPKDQVPGRRTIMENHSVQPGFSCVFAEDAAGTPVGLAYGFHGVPGQWWHDVVMRALADRNGEGSARGWLGDAFDLAEVHVHPDHQGRGIGRAMVVAVCGGRPERTAVLSTRDRPTTARHLYHSMGFVDLLTRFVFPGGHERYAILGTVLPLKPMAGRPADA